MTTFGKELKIYADQGLRTEADWLSRGREVAKDSKPRSDAAYRGSTVSLFSRDQTRARTPATR
jgi:hypothetical protein